MSSLAKVLRADFDRYLNGKALGMRSGCVAILRSPGFQALLAYRLCCFALSCRHDVRKWPLLAVCAPVGALGTLFARQCYGIRLSLSAQIGPGFSITHFGGVEVQNCRVGEGCCVAQQTRIGSPEDVPGPQIGDGVWIGAHARILTPVTVGDGATIAPGARVTRNVPKRSLVVGDPARIVSRSYDNSAMQPHG